MVEVRPATPADIPQMVELGRRFAAEMPYTDAPYDPGAVRSMVRISQSHGICVVVEDAGKIVGAAVGVKSTLWYASSVTFGAEMAFWIDVEYRRGSTAVKLVRQLEWQAKAAGCKLWSMMLMEHMRSESMERFYLRMGYKPTERVYLKEL